MSDYKSKYFSDEISLDQISCRCGCGKSNLDSMILKILDEIREGVCRPININSGSRCKKHDLNVYLTKLNNQYKSHRITLSEFQELAKLEQKKERTSSHIKGLAVDIRVNGNKERYEIMREIFQLVSPFIPRIFIGEKFIHIDIDEEKEQEVLGLY